MRHKTCFDTIQALVYHLCTALKPILCILCQITSYQTPSASFNFDHTSSTYCFLIQLWNQHSQCEAHDRLRYNLAPYKPPLYSFKASIMHFMSITSYTIPSADFNFDQPSSTYCFKIWLKINIVSVRLTTVFDTHQLLIYHLCSALKPILCILCHITS